MFQILINLVFVILSRFPETSQLQPPILGLYNVNFNYPEQPPLFKKVEFGIDMDSRVAIVGKTFHLRRYLRNLPRFYFFGVLQTSIFIVLFSVTAGSLTFQSIANLLLKPLDHGSSPKVSSH